MVPKEWTCACRRPTSLATDVACYAHTRRKFIDAESSEPDLSAEILSRIRELYVIERVATEEELDDDQRGALRREKATPIQSVVSGEIR